MNGASHHVLRACLASSDWCEQYDAAVVSFVERLVEAPLDGTQRAQLWLPLKYGGLGLGSACLRRSAAYLASWEQCFGEVAQARGAASAQALLAEIPKAAAAMEAAGADLRGLGVWRYHADWAGCLDSGKPRRQKLYGSVVQGAARKRLLAQLGGDDRIDFRSAGGGGGAFLLPPSEQTHLMPDDHFTVATRLRLRVPHPGHLGRQPPGQAQQCGHQYVQSRRQCTGLLDSRGLHGLVCNVGGGVDHRHDRIRDWLARLIRDLTGQAAVIEQFVPKWDRVVRVDGADTIERARLDVVFHKPPRPARVPRCGGANGWDNQPGNGQGTCQKGWCGRGKGR